MHVRAGPVCTEPGDHRWRIRACEHARAPHICEAGLFTTRFRNVAGTCMCLGILQGLEDAISVSIVHPTWAKTRPDDPEDAHCGWQFADPSDPPKPNPEGAELPSLAPKNHREGAVHVWGFGG
eukprot:294305-Chlamydomonas_euryale.AAC.2